MMLTQSVLVINSQMRRIDLVCKLIGPFVIALLDGISTEIAILVNLGMNAISVLFEYISIAKVSYVESVEIESRQAYTRRSTTKSPNSKSRK